MNQYLKVAEHAAKKSRPMFVKYFGKATNVRAKTREKRNIVTDADLKIEKTIRKIISSSFPEHFILGEEYGGKHTITKNQYVWIIDPVDGTNNFVQGIPYTCVSIALWDYKGPLVAVVFNPATGSLYTAERGKGARLNGKKISVSSVNDPLQAFGGVGWTRSQDKKDKLRLFATAAEKFGRARALGSTTLQMCFTADQKMDYYFATGVYIWDFAAAALIVTEAGGKVTDIRGKPLTLSARSVVASNGRLHNYIIKNLSA